MKEEAYVRLFLPLKDRPTKIYNFVGGIFLLDVLTCIKYFLYHIFVVQWRMIGVLKKSEITIITMSFAEDFPISVFTTLHLKRFRHIKLQQQISITWFFNIFSSESSINVTTSLKVCLLLWHSIVFASDVYMCSKISVNANAVQYM